MEAITCGERVLTELDFARLERLDAGRLPDGLAAAMTEAELVPSREVPADVVTMYSMVLVEDPVSGRQQRLTVCYPEDADPAQGFVSVLSPVGASLLGLRVGAQARWRTPGSAQGAARIVELLFQPEASGDFTT